MGLYITFWQPSSLSSKLQEICYIAFSVILLQYIPLHYITMYKYDYNMTTIYFQYDWTQRSNQPFLNYLLNLNANFFHVY